ncbi:putative Ef-hand calcium binding protein [Melia azedarach]|uniref:Ef-hand calcium binding protein n=1 Tax=Melia azedarach TaxID=155640 RepID=A0ACC1YM44_MELAZ|nr:putative Ef-hand calcium binding protein [Melia azedarach]
MASYGGSYSSSSQSYAPSAPSLPDSYNQTYNSYTTSPPPPAPAPAYYGQFPPQQQQQQPYQVPGYGQVLSHGHNSFPPGTHPDVIRNFEMVDRDRSGFIDEKELQQALSSGYQKFSIGTIRLLMFLFKNPHDSLRIGPKEFAELWNCLGQWRAIFERYDQDRSGKIDLMELRDVLYSIGCAVPPSVLKLLMAKYDNGSGRKVELSFDSFVEIAMIIKGLTEKFKEKDPRYTGSAKLSYDSFMSMVIPFIVSYD